MTSLERRTGALCVLFADIVVAVGAGGCTEPARRAAPAPQAPTREPGASASAPAEPPPMAPPTSRVEERIPPKEVGGQCESGVAGRTKAGPEGANLVFGLSPKEPVDYVELVLFHSAEQGDTLMAAGKKCATANDWRSCESAVARALPPEGRIGFSPGCIPGGCAHGLVVTRGDDVFVLATPDEIVSFVAPVDTPSEALLVAFANEWSPGGDYYSTCDLVQGKGLTRLPGGGFELDATRMISSCPITTATAKLRVAKDGRVTEIARLGTSKPGPCAGRRPPGYRAPEPSVRDEHDPMATYLVELAQLEAASVGAFEILARELAETGAPDHLVRAALRSRRDEIRHARGAARLAHRYGAKRVRPAERAAAKHGGLSRRSLAALAAENEVEGCVREAFGALAATYQARHAADPRARAFFAVIARDETRHLALALSLRDFFRARLSGGAWDRVVRRRHRAVEELAAALEAPVDPRVSELAGVPTPGVARALVDRLARVVLPEASTAG